MSGIERRRASPQTHPYYHHHYYNYYGGGGWNTASGCRPGWTVQGGVCKPYRYGPWDIYGGRQSDYINICGGRFGGLLFLAFVPQQLGSPLRTFI